MRGNGWNQTLKTHQQSRNSGNRDVSGDRRESFLTLSECAKFSVAFKSHGQGIPKAFKSHQNRSRTSWNARPAAWWQNTGIRLLWCVSGKLLSLLLGLMPWVFPFMHLSNLWTFSGGSFDWLINTSREPLCHCFPIHSFLVPRMEVNQKLDGPDCCRSSLENNLYRM